MSNNSTRVGPSGSPDQPHHRADAGASSDERNHAQGSHAGADHQDVYEALMAMAASQGMREAGLGEAFARQMARNCQKFESLPASAQREIFEQFGDQAQALSELETRRLHSVERSQALVRWLQGVNLLLAMQGRGG
ncbi:hypothetical protein [Arenimonas sp. MALMAid1274]|uniref:hypothetical protein n=1 Tax=Arenimonas sp. MALMAid1274 TaxID=3411630 RepID=UPI003BA384E1